MVAVSRRSITRWGSSLGVFVLAPMFSLLSLAPVSAAATIDCSSAPSAAAATPAAAGGATPVAVADAAFPADGGELTVFAAASLTDAFEQIATTLESDHPGLDITYNFAGSQALVTQLSEGAPADVFASANTAQMTAAEENGSIAGEPVIFVQNRLIIVVPAANPAGIAAPADLAKPGTKLVLAAAEVPAGRYARESLCLMGEDAAYGEGFVDAVAANVVSEEEDVRDVLAKVELGEADAGIVYVSDAQAGGDQVATVEIPAGVNRIADYPIAATSGGDAALAEAFIAAVLSPEGQQTLEDAGFEPAP